MIRHAVLAALAVLAAVNVAELGSAWRNRSGPPDATIVLDERELEIVTPRRENSGLGLRFRFQPQERALGHPGGLAAPFDRAKLSAIGFDLSVAPGEARAERFYRGQLPRPAFAVLALDGEEWTKELERWQPLAAEHARRELPAMPALQPLVPAIAAAPRRASRLLPIDVGPDPEALRARYTNNARYLILHTVVRLQHDDGRAWGGGPSVRGYIDRLGRDSLVVPARVRRPLDDIVAGDPRPSRHHIAFGVIVLDHEPRFEARIRVGARLQPWILDLRRTTP